MHNSTALSSALAPVKRRIPTTELLCCLVLFLLSLSGHSEKFTWCTKFGEPLPVFCSSKFCSLCFRCWFSLIFFLHSYFFVLFSCFWSFEVLMFSNWCFCVSDFCAVIWCLLFFVLSCDSIGWSLNLFVGWSVILLFFDLVENDRVSKVLDIWIAHWRGGKNIFDEFTRLDN